MKRIVVREALCSGCRACEVACVAWHEGYFGTATARIRIVKVEEIGADQPHVCRRCRPAPCVLACPTGALFQVETSRAIGLAADTCIACSACVDACPFGVAIEHPQSRKPLICDLCDGDPACVKRCATGAIAFEHSEAGPAKRRAGIAQQPVKGSSG